MRMYVACCPSGVDVASRKERRSVSQRTVRMGEGRTLSILRAARKVELRETLEPALGERARAVPSAALHMSTHTCDDGQADSLTQPADSLRKTPRWESIRDLPLPTAREHRPRQREWVSLLEAVIAQKDDPNMMIYASGNIEFTQGEHPTLRRKGYQFRFFSSKVSGRLAGNVDKCLREVEIVAARYLVWGPDRALR
ncbi:hypothetical protein DFH09DRAFT_1083313 [Mycena vulgaris]|nr:hypothetical protein DFH09DRAFT_1083313 [Mycena vulgaris]